jgi:hypothetical protein
VADVLRANSGASVRVFVVWEPVLPTDWGTPGAALTGNIPDGRATQFWDPDRRLSAALGGVAKLETLAAVRNVSFRMKDVVWDAALVYPAGTRWGNPAALLVAPVVKYREDLSDTLKRVLR